MPTKAKEVKEVKKTTKSTKETKPRATKKTTTTTKKATNTKKAATKKEPVAKKETKKTTTTKKAATTKKATATKKTTTTKKAATPKKEATVKKETKKVPAAKKETKTTKTAKATKTAAAKKTTAKKATTTKKTTTTKKAATKKTTTTKKSTTAKKATTKKAASKTKTVAKKEEKVVPSSIEYYDLPNNYNQTMVRVLFQTPKKLFVYWEISEADRLRLLEEHGKDFFYHSTPYLVVRNDTKNYSFEIEINDFANSWYFDVPDSKCDYSVELIRKHHETNATIPIRGSNELEVPNNHILFEQNRREIFFINVKNNYVTSRNIANLQFIKHLGIARPITLNAFYNKFYDDRDIYDLNNPSSYIYH